MQIMNDGTLKKKSKPPCSDAVVSFSGDQRREDPSQLGWGARPSADPTV